MARCRVFSFDVANLCRQYTQMSGRAGRRGKDSRGIVIQMVDEKMEPAVCKGMLYGQTENLNSSYFISYNMLLNLMRVEDVDPEFLLRASFHQFQRESDVPALTSRAEELEKEAKEVDVGTDDEAELAVEYYTMDQQLLVTRRKIKSIVQKPDYVWKFLQQPGRILDVSIQGESYGWGALVACQKKQGTDSGGEASRLAALSSGPAYTLRVMLMCVDRHFDDEEVGEREKAEDASNAGLPWRGSNRDCRPARLGVDDGKIIHMRDFCVSLGEVERISAVRIFMPQDLTSSTGRKKVELSVRELIKRFPDNTIPLLDPVKDMGIEDRALETLLGRARTLSERLSAHKLSTDFDEAKRVSLVTAYEKKSELLEQARALREEARSCQMIVMKDDLKKMKKVLKRLGHVDANGVIQTKGRTACEINTSDELVVVELIFTGVFNDLSPEQCATLLSCMTYDDRVRDDEDDFTSGLKPLLLKPFHKLRDVARIVVRTQIACHIELNEDDFVQKFNPGM